jgi:hypothetical protein
MKLAVEKLFNKLGYDISISKIHRPPRLYDPYTTINLKLTKVVDLEALAQISLSMLGMISTKSGQILYTLYYELKGNVDKV